MRKIFILTFCLLSLISCKQEKSYDTSKLPQVSVWARSGHFDGLNNQQITEKLKELKSYDFEGIYLDANVDFYKRFAPLAKEAKIQLHAWKPTMINSSKKLMTEHRDWYAVSRNNESCIDKPPYVNYYRLLCPTSKGVQDYLHNKYMEIAKIDGVVGVHFDYIRYCDVYLPIGLQPKYNLVQDHEMAEYDFCYCERCRKLFKEEFGRDPLTMNDPANDLDWRNWRLKQVVNIVNTITPDVKKETGKWVTAAVFPTPRIAKRIVRQDWGKFKIDAVMPMLYIKDYNAGIPWIGERVKEGIETMEVKKKIFSGFHLGHIPTPKEIKEAIATAMNNGASGVVLFDYKNMKKEQMQAVKEAFLNNKK